MSGETARQESGWTVDTLKQHYDKLREADQRALEAALLAVKEEGRKTELAAEKRFDLLNELRQGVATKEQFEALEKVVQTIAARLDRSDGKTQGSEITMSKIYAAIGAVGAILGIIILVANKVI